MFIELNCLQAAQIAAEAYGFIDLDVDTDDRGVKITAQAKSRSVTARGKTMEQAVENLIGVFSGD